MKKSKKISLLYSQIVFFIFLPIWIELTKFLHPFVIIVVWLSIISIVLLGGSWLNKEKIRISNHILHVLILFYSVGLLILLFFRPKNQSYNTANLIPFNTIRFYLSGNVDDLIAFYNLAANIGLFIPFGLYYAYVNKKPTLIQILFITICSISIIEGLQFFTKRGSLDIDDLLLNVLGVIIGYLTHPLVQKVLVIK